MISDGDTAQLVSTFREAAQAIEERGELIREVDRLREVESAANKLCSDYYFSKKGKAEVKEAPEMLREMHDNIVNLNRSLRRNRV